MDERAREQGGREGAGEGRKEKGREVPDVCKEEGNAKSEGMIHRGNKRRRGRGAVRKMKKERWRKVKDSREGQKETRKELKIWNTLS